MRIVILLAFFLSFATANAQISAGSISVANYGDHYEIKHTGPVFNKTYPKPDSASLRLIVYCPKTGATDVNDVPIGSTLSYKMGGTNYISATVIWWRNGIKKSQTSIPTVCVFGLNPLECFLKV